jgi:hypothetical protein
MPSSWSWKAADHPVEFGQRERRRVAETSEIVGERTPVRRMTGLDN